MDYPPLTPQQRDGIREILERRANDIASFKSDYEREREPKREIPGSVELALTREIQRLRSYAKAVCPKTADPEPED